MEIILIIDIILITLYIYLLIFYGMFYTVRKKYINNDKINKNFFIVVEQLFDKKTIKDSLLFLKCEKITLHYGSINNYLVGSDNHEIKIEERNTISVKNNCVITCRNICVITCGNNCVITCGSNGKIDCGSDCKIICNNYCNIICSHNCDIDCLFISNIICKNDCRIHCRYDCLIKGGIGTQLKPFDKLEKTISKDEEFIWWTIDNKLKLINTFEDKTWKEENLDKWEKWYGFVHNELDSATLF